MSYQLEINQSPHKTGGFKRAIKISFELMIYLSIFFFGLSYKSFNIKELTLLVLLALFLLSYVIKFGPAKKVDGIFFTGFFTIVFILIFDKIDNTSVAQFVHWPLLERISIPTVFLSIVIMLYTFSVVLSGSIVIRLGAFAKSFAISCFFIVVVAALFYAVLYLQYRLNSQADLQLLNKIIKYCFIILLFQECVIGSAVIKRLSLGLLISISAVLLLDIVF
ncbi:hypothetical protein [Mucilaginibacter lappiensis]|uniref:Uncharacterized protein n=1 Tax=Mucilaginibacter lappiensis TaxID=354630 RepID=A0A841JIZ9_9SPHI|nr:hypothetical protein [Mucilaginibacter lappiensis]MBB6130920.1 hypothetical protein [Mucilaginibacter lappiensis]